MNILFIKILFQIYCKNLYLNLDNNFNIIFYFLNL